MTIPAIYHWPAFSQNAEPTPETLIASDQTIVTTVADQSINVKITNPRAPAGQQRSIWIATLEDVGAVPFNVTITGTNLANQLVTETIAGDTAVGFTFSTYSYASVSSIVITPSAAATIEINARWGNDGIIGFWQSDWNKHIGHVTVQVVPRSAPVSPGQLGPVANLITGTYSVYASLDRIIDIYDGAAIPIPTVYTAGPTFVEAGIPLAYPTPFTTVLPMMQAANTPQIVSVPFPVTTIWVQVVDMDIGYTFDFTVLQQGPA
jgi:hypothetical protein